MHLNHSQKPTGKFLITVLFLLLGACSPAPRADNESAEIAGEVVAEVPPGAPFPEIAGKTVPRQGFPVYMFTWQESAAIRDWFEKLSADMKALEEEPNDTEKRWIAEKRAEDIYRMVVAGGPCRSRKTDKQGRFFFKNLKVGEKYFLVGASLEEGGIILLPHAIGPLSPGINKARLVDKW